MNKDEVLKRVLTEMEFCLNEILEETPKDNTFGYARYFQYSGLTKCAYLCDLISFEDMMTFNDNAYDLYKQLRDKDN